MARRKKSYFRAEPDARHKPRGGAAVRCPVCDARTLVLRVKRDAQGCVRRHRICVRDTCKSELTTIETKYQGEK